MTDARSRLAAATALLGALAAACAGSGFGRSDLPEAPLAVVHRTREETERVAELLDRARGKGGQGAGRDAPIRLERVSELLGMGRTNAERRAAYQGRLALVEPRSGAVTRLDFATRGARPLDWSPDHERLLLMSQRRGSAQVFEYRFEGRELRPVTHGPAVHVGACYGPGGRFLLARSVTLEGGERGLRIFLTEPGGGSPRPVTPGPRDGAPDWSAAAGVLVYETKDAAGEWAIASLSLQGSEAGDPRIVAQGRHPVVTPDGRWVVYSTETRRGWRLWRMRPDGSARRVVAETGQEQRAPAVSPDGRFVAYVVKGEGARRRLWVRRLDGVGRGRPLLERGDALQPKW